VVFLRRGGWAWEEVLAAAEGDWRRHYIWPVVWTTRVKDSTLCKGDSVLASKFRIRSRGAGRVVSSIGVEGRLLTILCSVLWDG
jgi:hypothetical protein